MKVVAFVGSPRTEGSTDLIVRQVLKGAEEEGADTSIYHLGLLDVNGCVGCMGCRKTGVCVVDDGMTPLYEVLHEADAVVLGTPIYFFYMTAQMKAFTDRLFAFIGEDFETRLERKETVLVVTQGADSPEYFESQIRSMTEAWGMCGLAINETILSCSTGTREQVEEEVDMMCLALEAGRGLVRAGS